MILKYNNTYSNKFSNYKSGKKCGLSIPYTHIYAIALYMVYCVLD